MYSQDKPDRSYSSDELEDIKRWYIKDNLPLHEVARRVNDKHYHGDMFRTEKSLESKLLRLKIYKKAPKPDAIDVDKKYAHIADLKKKMSYTQIADETGLSVGSVKNIINKVKTGHSIAQAVSMDDLKEKVVYFFKHKSGTGPTSIIDLSNKLEVHPAKVQETIESLKKDHYNFETLDSSIELSSTIKPEPPMKIDSKSFFKSSGKIIRFGAIGDTHLCSLYARENCLQVMYDIYEREGINKVFLAGNMIDGERPFNKYDIHTRGIEGQVGYFIKNFPRRKGIETHFITGDDHEGWYCFSEGTEILTQEHGWVEFKDLSGKEHVATKTPDGIFEWQIPKKVIKKNHSGSVIHFKHRSIDVTVTPDHRFEVLRKSSMHGKPKKVIMTAQEIHDTFKPRCVGIPRTTDNWTGHDIGTIDIPHQKISPVDVRSWIPGKVSAHHLAVLCGWYATEGCIDHNIVLICQCMNVHKENYELIVDVFKNLGCHNIHKTDLRVWTSSKDMAVWLSKNCGDGWVNKCLPDWVLDMPKETLLAVFDAMIRGDGHNRGKGSGWKFYSGSQKLLAQMAEICQKIGLTTSTIQGKGCINMHVGEIHKTAYLFEKPSMEAYDGKVYCVSVPNERIFVRKNGKTLWSMNCQDVNINIGDKIQHEAEKTGRKDLIYIGHMERDIELEGARTSQRIRVTHPGGGSCFDDTAEILTKDRGWIKFSELSLNDEVATMTKFEHRFEWQKPTHITDEPYDGDLIHFKARCFDFRVTPNHGLWVRYNRSYHTSLQPKEMPQKAHNRNRVDWHREDAQFVYEHYSRQNFSIPTVSDNWIGELIPVIEVPRLACLVKENKRNELQMQHVGNQKIEDMAELIAWYVTEGYADKKRVAICQSLIANPKNHKHITDLVSRMGLRYSVSGRDNKDICIGSTELSAWLKEQCGHLSRHKYLPLWLKNQPKDILNIVFKTMVSGDGWKTGRSFGYKSISKRLRHDMCEIAQKLGYATTESKDTVHIRMVQNLPTINSKPTRVKYNGKIYCCSVPNELIYVRCNGKAFWSHNSYALSYTSQKYAESLTGGDKPRVVLCFTPETPVIMGNGKLKPIRTIKGGDKVLAEDSKICEVIEQVGSMYKGEVISIIASGIHDDRAWCKPDHPIYCLRKSGIIDYIPAKKVQVGDYVLTPSKNGKTPSIVSRYGAPGMTVTKDGFWRPVVEILKNEYNGPMYDLRVDDMNSYVANYYLVHNCGHYHKLEYCYPREIHMIQVGAFQDQTPFMRKKRLQSMVGGAIVELHQDDEGIINRCKVEFVTFYDKQFYEYKWK